MNTPTTEDISDIVQCLARLGDNQRTVAFKQPAPQHFLVQASRVRGTNWLERGLIQRHLFYRGNFGAS